MKWIGQHIWNLITSFHSKIYWNDVDTTIDVADSSHQTIAETTDRVLTRNTSTGQIKATTFYKAYKADSLEIADSTSTSELKVGLTSGGVVFDNGKFVYKPSSASLKVYADDTDATEAAALLQSDLLQLINTANNANPVNLNFYKKRKDGSGANDNVAAVNGDQVGSIGWFGTDAQTSPQWWREYATIIGSIEEASNSNECGKLSLKTLVNNTVTDGLLLTGKTNGKIDVTIGSSPTSLTTINGDVTIQNTANSDARPILKLYNNRSSDNSDGGSTGEIHFSGKDDGTPSEKLYGKVTCIATDVSTTSEDSRMIFWTTLGNNPIERLTLGAFGENSIIHGPLKTHGDISVSAGPTAVPSLVLDYQQSLITSGAPIGDISWRNDDDDGTTLSIRGVATQDHASNSAGGSKFEFYTTEDDESSLELAATINENKDFTVHGGNLHCTSGVGYFYGLNLTGGFTSTYSAQFGGNLTVSQTSDTDTGPRLTFLKYRGGGSEPAQVGDEAGELQFLGENDTGLDTISYGNITCNMASVTDTDEAGKLSLGVATSNGTTALNKYGFILEGATDGYKVNTTLGFGSSSTTTVTGTLTMGSTATLDNSGNLLTNAATATALQNARTIGGVSFDGTANIDLPGVNTTGNQDTTGNAATATTAKNIAGQANSDVNISSDKNVIVTIDADNDTSNYFKIKNSSTDLFSVNETGAINFNGTAITNVNTGAAQMDIQTDGNINFTIDRSNNTTGNYFSFINYNQEVARLDESGNLRLEGSQLSNSATASNFDIISSRILKLQHAGAYDIELGNSTNQDVLKVQGNQEIVTVNGALNTTGLITGKQRQVYSQSFFDDLGTTKHYLPWKDINEQLQIYQEEAAMLMPCDGRIVSVSVRVQFPNADGDITIGVHTCPVNVSSFVSNVTNNWIEEETELLSLVNADDNHLFHFAFDNAKHFESSELCTISIQCSQDISASAYWHVTTVVEYDWNTFLGTTSAEIESTP